MSVMTKRELSILIKEQVRNFLKEADPGIGVYSNLGLGDKSKEYLAGSLTGAGLEAAGLEGASGLRGTTDDAVIYAIGAIWKAIKGVPPQAVEAAAKTATKSIAAKVGSGALAALGAFSAAPVILVWASADLLAHGLDEWTDVGAREKKYRPQKEVKMIKGARNLLRDLRRVKVGAGAKTEDVLTAQVLVAKVNTVFAKYRDEKGSLSITRATDKRDTDRLTGRLAVGEDLYVVLKQLYITVEKLKRKLCADKRVMMATEKAGLPNICSEF